MTSEGKICLFNLLTKVRSVFNQWKLLILICDWPLFYAWWLIEVQEVRFSCDSRSVSDWKMNSWSELIRAEIFRRVMRLIRFPPPSHSRAQQSVPATLLPSSTFELPSFSANSSQTTTSRTVQWWNTVFFSSPPDHNNWFKIRISSYDFKLSSKS